MDRPQLVAYWRNFFSDLLLGTFKKLFLFSMGGMGLAALAGWGLDAWYLEPTGWAPLWQWLVLGLALVWFLLFGVLHGVVASILVIMNKKLREAVNGLHDLLDVLVKGVFAQYPTLSKRVTKRELGEKFDQLGQKFLEDLKLKGGLFSFIKRGIFRIIIRGLKFFFLDDVMEEIQKKAGDEVTRADIESAVRRVGVEFMLETIYDSLLVLHIGNAVLLLLFFSLPFMFFWIF